MTTLFALGMMWGVGLAALGGYLAPRYFLTSTALISLGTGLATGSGVLFGLSVVLYP